MHRERLEFTRVEDEIDQRQWCAVTYNNAPWLKIYDIIMNFLNIIAPFTINLISTILILHRVTQSKINVKKQEKFSNIIEQQLMFHKHLIINPLILITLTFSRLIISLVSVCGKETKLSYVNLFGYFISFLPPALTVFVFVTPSITNNSEFKTFFKRTRTFKWFTTLKNRFINA
ncbi:unnamed protein product [Didymodactylos carnosus]|uniref:G-protein coupled receptors family 1 profile domain-containing protein n=1 Tax=Didymodactylos carnosus TaxID=1234261 RepID=A0A8S2NBF3_9BILA|nr:unnamed protein product [Didymodactylos carnosus]CAF3995023.1 unnamed protein product [Didymodactylos carnosus]